MALVVLAWLVLLAAAVAAFGRPARALAAILLPVGMGASPFLIIFHEWYHDRIARQRFLRAQPCARVTRPGPAATRDR